MTNRILCLTLAGVLAGTAAVAEKEPPKPRRGAGRREAPRRDREKPPPAEEEPAVEQTAVEKPAVAFTKGDAPMREVQPRTLRFRVARSEKDAPSVEVAMEPEEGDDLVYEPVAGWTSKDKNTGQLSVLLYVKNKEAKPITLKKVTFAYGSHTKDVASDVTIAAGAESGWQNSRDYHEVGDVVYFESGIPSNITIKLHFKGYTAPVSLTKTLKPYDRAFAPPFKTKDLAAGEVWESASTHGGGSQVFAYDMGVEIPGQGALLPGKDGSANTHYRVWGKPIYAMADGIVKGFNNTVPNNPRPGEEAAWQSYEDGGGGNHFYIQHGDVIALYAHMQKGSLTDKLLKKGAEVKRGDVLGLAGNAGSSSGPHLHIHVRKETTIETGPFRPLLFSQGFVIAKESYPQPQSNVAWDELDTLAIPGKAGQRSYVWPAKAHPYCDYPTDWGEVSKHGVSNASYQAEFDKAWTCGYAPVWVDGYNAGGETYFNIIFRPSKAAWEARHNMDAAKYQAEFDTWDKAGYRLINVDSYLRDGSVQYAAVWEKSDGPTIVAYHGKPASEHQTTFEALGKDGYTPVNVSSVMVGGTRYVTALYEKKNVGGFYLKSAMTLAEYKQLFDEYGKDGFELVYLNGYNDGGTPMLSGIWYKNAPYSSYWAKHHLDEDAYQSEYTSYLKTGYLTRCVTGYQDGGARYEGIWYK
jgi:murein DD-endopeptidase MepM/ murein hydrolase activator NlpD